MVEMLFCGGEESDYHSLRPILDLMLLLFEGDSIFGGW